MVSSFHLSYPPARNKINSEIYHILVVNIMKRAKREPKTLSEVEIPVLNSCGTALVIRKKIRWSEVFGKNKHA